MGASHGTVFDPMLQEVVDMASAEIPVPSGPLWPTLVRLERIPRLTSMPWTALS